MIIVVADTTPIHYLIQIEAIDVLARFFDQVIIPTSVEKELLNPSIPKAVREWVLQHPAWIEIRSALQIAPLTLIRARRKRSHWRKS